MKNATQKPLAGYTAEESELIRAYRRSTMRKYWQNKTPEERAAIHRKHELAAARRFAEKQQGANDAAAE